MRKGIKAREYTVRLVYAAVFAAIIAVGAFIKIPMPLVPVTLQLAFCMLAAMLLGWKTATLAVVIYVALGLAGLPIFTAGGGLSYVLYPTFGYTAGFVFGTMAAGMIARGVRDDKQPSFRRNAAACAVGCAIVYVIGVPYMYLISTLYLGRSLTVGYAVLSGWVLFIPTDLLLCGLSCLAATKLIPILYKSGLYGQKIIDNRAESAKQL